MTSRAVRHFFGVAAAATGAVCIPGLLSLGHVRGASPAPPSIQLTATPADVEGAFTGTPRTNYLIQRSDDLAAWINLSTVLMPATGTAIFHDRPAAGGKAFYRLIDTSFNARKLAIFGDSISDRNSNYKYSATLGSGRQNLEYNLRPTVADPQLYIVTQVNPGGTGGLSGTVSDNIYTITLARNNGVVTSTLADVIAYVNANWSDMFRMGEFTDGAAATTLALPQGLTSFVPKSNTAVVGVWTWVRILMRNSWDFSRRYSVTNGIPNLNPEGDWDFGYSGQTAAALALNPGPLGDVLKSDADLIVVQAGTNDIYYGFGVETTIRNVLALWDKLLAAKRRIVAVEIPPSGDQARQAQVMVVNARLATEAASRGILLYRWDPGLLTDGLADPQYFPDGIHPSDLGAFKQAQFLLPSLLAGATPAATPYDVDDHLWLNANPGTAGSGRTGIAPDWNLLNPGMTGAKEAASDGGPEWQRVMVSQPRDQYDGRWISSEAVTTGFKPGDKLLATMEVECDPTEWNVKALYIQLLFNDSNRGFLSTPMTTGNSRSDFQVGKAFTGVLETPPAIVPAGVTSVRFRIGVFGSGALKFRRAGIRFTTKD